MKELTREEALIRLMIECKDDVMALRPLNPDVLTVKELREIIEDPEAEFFIPNFEAVEHEIPGDLFFEKIKGQVENMDEECKRLKMNMSFEVAPVEEPEEAAAPEPEEPEPPEVSEGGASRRTEETAAQHEGG